MLTAPGLLKVWNVHPGSRGGLGHLHTWQMAACPLPGAQGPGQLSVSASHGVPEGVRTERKSSFPPYIMNSKAVISDVAMITCVTLWKSLRNENYDDVEAEK